MADGNSKALTCRHAASPRPREDREDRGRVDVHQRYVEQLAEPKQRKERRRFGIVTVRGLEHTFVPWGTTLRTAKGNEARTQTHVE